jgi:HlyD family secretion protein
MDITSPASRDSQDTKPTPSSQSSTRKYKTRRRRIPGFVKGLIVLVVLAGIAGAIYLWRTQTNAAAAQQPTLALPVTQGDLNVTVQTNGTLAATRQASITYQTTGNVVDVKVKPGDKVEAGQVLLTQTDSDQKEALTQAQAALNTAQAKLSDLQKGPSPGDLASAQADVASAQAALNAAKAGPTAKDISDARADLRSAQANLDSVKAGATSKQMADAQADVQSAQANYDNVKAGATSKQISDAEQDLNTAQAAYNALVAPPTQDAIDQAKAQLAAAQASLTALKQQPTQAELSTAQLAVTQAQDDLDSTQLADDLAKQNAQIARDKADTALEQAQLAYSVIANEVLNPDGTLNVPSTNAKYTTYWNDYYAMKNAQSDQAQAANALNNAINKEAQDISAAQAKLNDAKTQLAHVQAGATPDQIMTAQATIATNQKTLDDLMAGPSKSDVATAQANVTKAQTALDQLKAGPTAADLATAQDTLTKAQDTLTELQAGPTAANLATAQTTVDKAQDALNALLAGPDSSAVAAAEATLAQKQAALQTLQQPPTASDLASAQQDVATAQKGVDDANTELDKTVLKAPFSGTVASVTAEPNDVTAVGTEALSIYDESGMYVKLQVNETDIQKIKPQQNASITIDALPNEVFTGTINQVSNVSQTSQDVVTYEVDVPFNPRGLPVKSGMNATANIIVESHPNVWQVPTRAITTRGQNKSITLLPAGEQTPVPNLGVTTGASNTQFTEITSCVDTSGNQLPASQCLRAGDRVEVTLPSGTTTNNGGNGGFGGFGGGGFGGGFGGGRNGGQPVIIQGPGSGK